MSRYKYIVYAYSDMARWMAHGTEEIKKLKRYVHRHLDIPDTLPPAIERDDAKEVMMEFAYQYVSALLTYCSDSLKEGMCRELIPTNAITNTFPLTGYFIMGVRTTDEFKRIPVGKVGLSPAPSLSQPPSPPLSHQILHTSQVCMVYFHAVDVALGRKDVDRRAWQFKCHLPRIMFTDKRKQRKGVRTSAKLFNYVCFKRMMAIKPTVFQRHKVMLRLYEKYCHQGEIPAYWRSEEDDEHDTGIEGADETNETDVTDEF